MPNKIGFNVGIFVFSVLALFWAYSFVRTVYIWHNSIETKAVVAYRTYGSKPTPKSFFPRWDNIPVIYFYDQTGKEFSIKSCSDCSKQGDTVIVAYLKSDPRAAIVKDKKEIFYPFFYAAIFSGALFLTVRKKKRLELAYMEYKKDLDSRL